MDPADPQRGPEYPVCCSEDHIVVFGGVSYLEGGDDVGSRLWVKQGCIGGHGLVDIDNRAELVDGEIHCFGSILCQVARAGNGHAYRLTYVAEMLINDGR